MQFFGSLDIGNFQYGENSKIAFRIVNPSDSEIVLNKPTGTCGCISVTVDTPRIPPRDSIDAILAFRINEDRKPIWRQRLFFDGKEFGDPSVEIEVISELTNILSFHDREFLVEILNDRTGRYQRAEPKTQQRRLAFTATPPIDLNKLELRLIPDSEIVRAEIVETGKTVGEVLLTVYEGRLKTPALSLACQITDPASMKTTVIRGVIARRSPITVVPSAIRLMRNSEGLLSGHAIVAYHGPLAPDKKGDDDSVSQRPLVSARIFGKSIPVRLNSATTNVARVTIEIPQNLEKKLVAGDMPDLHWNVAWHEDRESLSSTIFVTQ